MTSVSVGVETLSCLLPRSAAAHLQLSSGGFSVLQLQVSLTWTRSPAANTDHNITLPSALQLEDQPTSVLMWRNKPGFEEFSLSIIFILPVFSSSLFSVIITVKAVLGQFAADLTVWRLSPSPVCYSRSSGWKTASEKWIINQPWDTLMLFKMRTLSHSWTGEPTQSCSMMGWWMFDDCRYLETTSRGAENTFHVQTW